MQTLDGDPGRQRVLATPPGWTRQGDRLAKTFIRDDFRSAVLLAQRVAIAAAAADRRTDISIHANTVTFELPLHRGATGTSVPPADDDLAMARRIERLTGDHHHPIGLAGA